jgi:hypothetical protein
MTPLAFLATDEQILDIALRSISTKDYNIDGIDGQIIVAYAMKEDPDMSAEDLANYRPYLIYVSRHRQD